MMRQDAHEKAFEMLVQGQRLYEKQRDSLIEEGEKKLEDDFNKRIEDQRIKHKIAVAQKTNASRLEKMKKRNECMENLKTAAQYRLQSDYDSSSAIYRETLKKLIVQVSIQRYLVLVLN